MGTTEHHRIAIVGGGAAGISVAARLEKKVDDIVVIEPSDKHYYHPLWTLVGAGHAKPEQTERTEASVMPKGVEWVKEAASSFDPDNNVVETSGGRRIEYDVLIVCPGIQLDWDKMRRVRSRRRARRCFSPSSTTRWNQRPRSRSSTPRSPVATCGT